jgi:hypothetical protein
VLLVGSGSDLPQPIQGRTLTVLEVDNLFDKVLKFDGNVQTLGLGIHRELRRKHVRGVDRIVKLGRMHVERKMLRRRDTLQCTTL